jgi:hypothetical protein
MEGNIVAVFSAAVVDAWAAGLDVEEARRRSAFLTGSDDGDVEHRQP